MEQHHQTILSLFVPDTARVIDNYMCQFYEPIDIGIFRVYAWKRSYTSYDALPSKHQNASSSTPNDPVPGMFAFTVYDLSTTDPANILDPTKDERLRDLPSFAALAVGTMWFDALHSVSDFCAMIMDIFAWMGSYKPVLGEEKANAAVEKLDIASVWDVSTAFFEDNKNQWIQENRGPWIVVHIDRMYEGKTQQDAIRNAMKDITFGQLHDCPIKNLKS